MEQDELATDALPVHGFEHYKAKDYALAHAPFSGSSYAGGQWAAGDEPLYYIVSPKDVVIAKPRDAKDHISWLLQHGWHEKALAAVEVGQERSELLDEVGSSYLDHLIVERKYTEAASLCPKLLRGSASAWERWVFHFAHLRQLPVLVPYIPTENPRLRDTAYEVALVALTTNPSFHKDLLSTVKSWPPVIYSALPVISAIEPQLNTSSMTDALGELMKPDIFDFLEKHKLHDALREKVVQLMMTDCKHAVPLLTQHRDLITASKVVSQLLAAGNKCDSRYFLHLYLLSLFEANPHAGRDFHDMQIRDLIWTCLVHTFKKACVAAYPSTVQNDIVWFWPNSDPQYKDILTKNKPPYIPELDDPSYTKLMGNREIPYGYEVLIENLMDPAHVPYAHYGIMRTPQRKNSVKADREGGRPLEISVKNLDINGFFARQEWGHSKFVAPCIFSAFTPLVADQTNGSVSSAGTKEEPSSNVPQRRFLLIFICIPVSPGNSRLIWTFPRNVGVWIDRVVPRWMFHVGQNLILGSELYLLHLEERKIMDIGPSNWQKACFVPTKSDALVVSFRRWLNKYAGGQVDWGTKFSGALPPTPPREQLLDRYWSHVVNCRSCNVAYKGLNVLEVVLQVMSIASIGIVAAKQNMLSAAARNTLISFAVLSFVASRWLAHFVYKNFRYHDYNHAQGGWLTLSTKISVTTTTPMAYPESYISVT